MNENHKQKENEELIQLVSFILGSEEFGVEILSVQEIIRLVSITKIPNCPASIEGVINLRGRVIPIIDLRVRLGIENITQNNSTRIVVVELKNLIVGFIVDEVSEVLRIPTSIIEPPPKIVAGIDSEYVTSVGKLDDRLLILLDLEKLLSLEEKQELTNV